MAYQPKSYKKFVATAATATLVASALVPVAFAAQTATDFTDVAPQYKDAVDYLVDNKIAAGKTPSTFGTAENIIRVDAAIWIAKATLTEGEISAAPASTFTDVPARGKIYVDALKSKGYVNGSSATTFNSDANISRGEVALILAEAYDITGNTANNKFTDVNSRYLAAVSALKDNGITTGKTSTNFGTNDAITRGELAIWVHRLETLKVDLEVVDFAAANQKEHFVTFNSDVDELTASNEANYELKLNNVVVNPASYTIEVDEDNAKKVNITLTDAAANTITNGSFLTLTVSEDVLNTKLAPLADEYSKTLTFNDSASPTVASVEVDGDDLIVTFNDFVKNVGLVTVNGVNKNAVVSAAYSKEVVVDNGALNLANGTHSVQFANVADIASPNANVTSFTSGNFTLSDDVTVPSVEKLTQVDNDTFKIVFNKTVTQPTVTVKRNGLPLNYTVNPVVGKPNEFTVDVSDNTPNNLYDANATSTTVAVEVSAFKDSNNTVGNAYTTNFTFTKDTVAPTVVNRFNTVTGTTFDVRFNEEVTLEDASQIVFRDKDGVRQPVTATVVDDTDLDATILRISAPAVVTAGEVVAGTYNMTIGAGTVEDLEGNANASTNVSIVKSGSTSGSVTANAVAADSTITVNYGSAMSTTATTAGNYRLNNAALPAGSVLYFDTNKQTVVIELPAASIPSSGQVALTISESVVSETGAKVAASSRNLVTTGTGLVDNVKPTLVSAKKTNATTIELSFSENLAAVADAANTIDDFIVKVNGVTFTVANVNDISANDNKVTLTVPSYNVNQTVTVTTATTGINVLDVAGNTVTTSKAVTASN